MQVYVADRKFGPFEAGNTKLLKKICAAHALRSYFAVECSVPSSTPSVAAATEANKSDGTRQPENAVQRLTQLTQVSSTFAFRYAYRSQQLQLSYVSTLYSYFAPRRRNSAW